MICFNAKKERKDGGGVSVHHQGQDVGDPKQDKGSHHWAFHMPEEERSREGINDIRNIFGKC